MQSRCHILCLETQNLAAISSCRIPSWKDRTSTTNEIFS